MRTYGTREDLYTKARERGVVFIRFDQDKKPEVNVENERIVVQVTDPVLQMPLAIETDYLVLAAAIEASDNTNVILSKATMHLDPIKSYVTEACDGCALCLDVCPYRAISLEEAPGDTTGARRVVTDSALCKGCGLCEATCPKGGILIHGFTLDQLKVQVEAAMEPIRLRIVKRWQTKSLVPIKITGPSCWTRSSIQNRRRFSNV